MLRKVLGLERGHFLMECGHVIKKRGPDTMALAWCNPCQAGGGEPAITHLIGTEDLRVGTPRPYILTNLGVPDALIRTAPDYPVPMIWQYGDTYLMFPPATEVDVGLVCVVREGADQEPEFLLGQWSEGLSPDQLRRSVELRHDESDADRNPDGPDARWADDGGNLVGCPD